MMKRVFFRASIILLLLLPRVVWSYSLLWSMTNWEEDCKAAEHLSLWKLLTFWGWCQATLLAPDGQHQGCCRGVGWTMWLWVTPPKQIMWNLCAGAQWIIHVLLSKWWQAKYGLETVLGFIKQASHLDTQSEALNTALRNIVKLLKN